MSAILHGQKRFRLHSYIRHAFFVSYSSPFLLCFPQLQIVSSSKTEARLDVIIVLRAQGRKRRRRRHFLHKPQLADTIPAQRDGPIMSGRIVLCTVIVSNGMDRFCHSSLLYFFFPHFTLLNILSSIYIFAILFISVKFCVAYCTISNCIL